MKRLSKQDILEGVNKRVSVYVKEYDAEVIVRPLTDGEISKIFSLIGSPSQSQGNGNVEIAAAGDNIAGGKSNESFNDLQKNFEALRHATAMGLVEPKLTLEEVSQMKFGVPEQLGTQILELSGVTTEEEVKKKGGRSKNS